VGNHGIKWLSRPTLHEVAQRLSDQRVSFRSLWIYARIYVTGPLKSLTQTSRNRWYFYQFIAVIIVFLTTTTLQNPHVEMSEVVHKNWFTKSTIWGIL